MYRVITASNNIRFANTNYDEDGYIDDKGVIHGTYEYIIEEITGTTVLEYLMSHGAKKIFPELRRISHAESFEMDAYEIESAHIEGNNVVVSVSAGFHVDLDDGSSMYEDVTAPNIRIALLK